MTWLTNATLALVLRRAVPVLVGAALGLLVDAGLLDGAVVEQIVQILSA